MSEFLKDLKASYQKSISTREYEEEKLKKHFDEELIRIVKTQRDTYLDLRAKAEKALIEIIDSKKPIYILVSSSYVSPQWCKIIGYSYEENYKGVVNKDIIYFHYKLVEPTVRYGDSHASGYSRSEIRQNMNPLDKEFTFDVEMAKQNVAEIYEQYLDYQNNW